MTETSLTNRLIDLLTPLVLPLGYEVIHVEAIPRQKLLRVFIDHLDRPDGVGIEDCVKVTRALDEPLDQMPEVEKVFGAGGYELEVSSPGIDRPLRTQRDYEKFKGREVRVHVFRPLSGEELGNPDYGSKNPKQKNFLGTLRGIQGDRVVLAVNLTGGHDKTQKPGGKKGKAASKKNAAAATGDGAGADSSTNSAEVVVSIPLPLISKANLEPDFDALEEGA